MLRSTLVLAALALVAPALAAAPDSTEPAPAADEVRPFALMVGDPAPPLTVEWIKGEPIDAFRDDHTYVVEFWATWCGPCVRAMPHLSELQRAYAARKVRFVGVNIWEQDRRKVRPFVEKMGDKMDYTVAMDVIPDETSRGKMANAWMEAAGKGGIPCSFIVRKGRVQWIGHPQEMDGPLDRIVAGTWDLERAAKDYHDEVAEAAARKRREERIQTALRGGDWKAALQGIEEVIAEDRSMEARLAPQKLFCLARTGDAAGTKAYAEQLERSHFRQNAQGLDFIARVVLDPENRELGLEPALAVRVAKKANELTAWKEPAALQTYATALERAGDLEQAIEMQEKAVERAAGTPAEGQARQRLEELRARQS